MRAFVAGLFAVVPCALAQFTGLAVTDDAGQIYFASTLVLRGESGLTSRIYRWSGERWEQFLPAFNAQSWDTFLPVYNSLPVVSGSGTVVGWTEIHTCVGGSSCLSYPAYSTSVILTADGKRNTVMGSAQMSRNGRFVIQYDEVRPFSAPVRLIRAFLDLQTGSSVNLDFHPLVVLSDGRVLGADVDNLFLWSPQGTKRRIAATANLGTPFISDNGERLLAVDRLRGELVSVTVATETQTALGKGVPVGIANNGLRALILDSTEPYVVDLLTGKRTALAPGTSVKTATLAGFGQFAILVTSDGRILRVNVATGDSQEMLARTPTVSLPSEATPCDAIPLQGTKLVDASEKPSVTLDGRPIPILAIAPSAIWVQIPCELDLPKRPSLDLVNNSPFDTTKFLDVVRYAPVTIGGDFPAIHQDFSGPVTFQRPAHSGEIVHVWGTGFGPVNRIIRTGEPAAASPLARLLTPPACRESQTGSPVEVVFAGLAPGLIGVYQLDLRIPEASTRSSTINCTLQEYTNVNFPVPMAAP